MSATGSPAAVTFAVRRATATDAAVLAHHRAAMFRDMGSLRPELYDALREAARPWFADAVPAGEYVAFLAAPADRPDEIVAGAGAQLRRQLPRPTPDGDGIEVRQQALVLNVYTEPAWRRRGLAALLMEHVLAWAREAGVGSVVLHASDEGRPLYEQLGFVATNEMRFTGPL
ncbi:MAG TPA: GNAT family N-acetyltransferase [Longimicrobium sp.]|nr:GNAT family N-acetyltransferase [Longimicrobium sp.]